MGSDKYPKKDGIISNFTKGEAFSDSYKNQLLLRVSPCTSTLLPFLLEKNLSRPFSLAKKRIHMDTRFKKKLIDLLRKLLGIVYPHRQGANGYITTLFKWLTLPSYVILYDKYMLFTHFYLMLGKKNRNLVCISSKRITLWH